MSVLLDIVNRFSDLVNEALRNRDKLRIKTYDIDLIDDTIVLTVVAEDRESAVYVKELVDKLVSRLLGGAQQNG
ncbi:hypothetical protein J7M00_06835 [bacterium]|nr:hypothetical protein [bacterium]